MLLPLKGHGRLESMPVAQGHSHTHPNPLSLRPRERGTCAHLGDVGGMEFLEKAHRPGESVQTPHRQWPWPGTHLLLLTHITTTDAERNALQGPAGVNFQEMKSVKLIPESVHFSLTALSMF